MSDDELKPEQNVQMIVDLKAAFDSYAKAAGEFRLYDDKWKVVYPSLGLAGEAGEVLEKVKKTLRDAGGFIGEDAKLAIATELGDVLWYIAALAADINVPFHIIPFLNISKLHDRKKRDTLRGSGDDR